MMPPFERLHQTEGYVLALCFGAKYVGAYDRNCLIIHVGAYFDTSLANLSCAWFAGVRHISGGIEFFRSDILGMCFDTPCGLQKHAGPNGYEEGVC